MTGSPCDTCVAGRAEQLERLGVDMSRHDYVIALAGNPNTGKSTVFNALTGLRQRTGNWPGKTVTRATGAFAFEAKRYQVVDLPGTYSLVATSVDEEVARDFVLFGRPDVTVVVVDASRLERNLNLVLQVLQISDRVVVCLNLVDEAERHGVKVDHRRLARDLGAPVVPTVARSGRGLAELSAVIAEVASGKTRARRPSIDVRDPAIERARRRVAAALTKIYPLLPNPDWLALRLLDGDQRLMHAARDGELGALGRGDNSASAAGAALVPRPPAAQNEALLRTVMQSRWQLGPNTYQRIAEAVYAEAARIATGAITRAGEAPRADIDRIIDRIVTSRRFGLPLMVLLLA
ncbi:MAG: 50S ribosome-binding GTPase, partial [Myxococcales bacterium]|nr:50S ribosome-binding GTPase [Myxococcales bacterium]